MPPCPPRRASDARRFVAQARQVGAIRDPAFPPDVDAVLVKLTAIASAPRVLDLGETNRRLMRATVVVGVVALDQFAIGAAQLAI